MSFCLNARLKKSTTDGAKTISIRTDALASSYRHFSIPSPSLAYRSNSPSALLHFPLVLYLAAVFLCNMVVSLRFLARSVISNSRLNTRTPTTAATATLRSYLLQNTCHAPHRRGLHTTIPRFAASVEENTPEQTSTKQHSNSKVSPAAEALNDPDWRHPHFGFAAADFPHLIYIKIPRTATKDDVRALVARAGLQE